MVLIAVGKHSRDASNVKFSFLCSKCIHTMGGDYTVFVLLYTVRIQTRPYGVCARIVNGSMQISVDPQTFFHGP